MTTISANTAIATGDGYCIFGEKVGCCCGKIGSTYAAAEFAKPDSNLSNPTMTGSFIAAASKGCGGGSDGKDGNEQKRIVSVRYSL